MFLKFDYKRAAALLMVLVGISTFLAAPNQLAQAQEDVTQPEVRQRRLRQAVQLTMQMEFEQARALIAELRAAAEPKADKGTLAAALMSDTAILALQYKPLEALATYRRIPSLTEIESDRRALAYVLSLRAFVSFYRGDMKQARADATRSLTLSDAATDKPEIAFTLSTLGLVQSEARQLDEAENSFRQSLALYEQLPAQMLAAFPLNNLGVIYQYREQRETSLEYFGRSLALSEQYGLQAIKHYTLKNMGDSYLRLNRNQEALSYYQQSLAERQIKGEPRELATIWSNIAQANKALERSDEAIQALEKCREIERTLNDPQADINADFLIGEIYFLRDDYRHALEYWQKSLSLAEARQQFAAQARAARHITHLMYWNNNVALTREYLQKSLRAAEASGDTVTLNDVYLSEGSFYFWQKEYHAALASYDKVLRAAKVGSDNAQIVTAWFCKADAHLQLGEYDQSEAALLAGQKLYESGRQHFSMHHLASDLWSRLEMARGRDDKALVYAQQAAALVENYGLSDRRSQTYTLVGRLLMRRGQIEAAYAEFSKAINHSEKQRERIIGDVSQQAFSFTHTLSPFHEMIRLLVGQKRFAEAFAFAERAKARALLNVLQQGKSDLTRSMTEQEKAEERRFETALRSLNLEMMALQASPQMQAAQLTAVQQKQQQARIALEDFQTRLYAAHPELKAQRGEMQPFKLSEAKTLTQGEPTVFLEYVVTDEQTYLFVFAPEPSQVSNQISVYEIPLRRDELAARALRWRQQLAERDPAFRVPARQLADLLLSPARAHLRGKTRLVIVPDDVLWELPFQALLNKSDSGERFLLEDHTISYAPSLTVLREMMRERDQRGRQPKTSLLAFGNPALPATTLAKARTIYRDFAFAPLPEAEREVKTLAQLYGSARSKVFTGTAADESQAKAEASSYNILHFATHGILNDTSPMYSHLLLAQKGNDEDGLLEAREVLKLDLRAELVTLSACETARGKLGRGEGVVGLSWAFFVAGSPATLVSQWKVESASTTNLMLGFYQNLQSTKPLSKATALRQSALRLLRSPEYKHPFYWASFVLIGDGR